MVESKHGLHNDDLTAVLFALEKCSPCDDAFLELVAVLCDQLDMHHCESFSPRHSFFALYFIHKLDFTRQQTIRMIQILGERISQCKKGPTFEVSSLTVCSLITEARLGARAANAAAIVKNFEDHIFKCFRIDMKLVDNIYDFLSSTLVVSSSSTCSDEVVRDILATNEASRIVAAWNLPYADLPVQSSLQLTNGARSAARTVFNVQRIDPSHKKLNDQICVSLAGCSCRLDRHEVRNPDLEHVALMMYDLLELTASYNRQTPLDDVLFNVKAIIDGSTNRVRALLAEHHTQVSHVKQVLIERGSLGDMNTVLGDSFVERLEERKNLRSFFLR